MIRSIITSLFLYCLISATALADVVRLQENAPDRYVVVKGDTLWAISGRFLKDPWRWPEVWKMNSEQIKNPHWIYPGDVVVLDRSGPTPQLRLVRGEGNDQGASDTVKLSPRTRAEQLDRGPIPSISLSAIAPFIGRPLVVEDDVIAKAPYVLAPEESRVVVGGGSKVYVIGIQGDAQTEWQFYRPGALVRDPETGEVLGREAIFLGTGRLTRPGDPATVEVLRANQEISAGVKLIPSVDQFMTNYVPHAPDKPVSARVASVLGGLVEAGPNTVVTVNKGARDGMEVGHVLALVRHGAPMTTPDKRQVRLPDERYGLVFVFRVFDRLSYALLMNTERPVHVGDNLQTP